jgi:hypothetical protein
MRALAGRVDRHADCIAGVAGRRKRRKVGSCCRIVVVLAAVVLLIEARSL